MYCLKVLRPVPRARIYAALISLSVILPRAMAGPDDPNYAKVPQPVLEEHPEWVKLYEKAFQVAFSKIQRGTPQNGFVDFYMDEAFNANIFQWDTSFMMMFARYGNGELPAITSLENFYRYQHKDGWIGRELREADGSSYWPKTGDGTQTDRANCGINPPLFSWAEWQDYRVSGDVSRFTKIINGKELITILVDYFEWIKANRRWDNGMYWTTSWANGMDKSSRLDRTRKADVCDHRFGNWIDITSQQALNAFYIAKIAGVLGRTELQKRYQNEHNEITQLINRKMWDEKDGFYYDLDQEEAFYKVKSPASFWPLIARVAEKKHVKRIVEEHIVEPTAFWTQHYIPTISKDDPTYISDGGYWDGAVWAPTTYQTIKGLEAQGYTDVARKIAMNHIQNIYYVYLQSGTIYENYQPEAALKGIHARPEFVGWSGVGPIAGLIENVMGIRVNGAKDSVTWDLYLSEYHGISQLQFGDNTIALYANDRVNSGSGTEISVETNSPFSLTVRLGQNDYTFDVNKGKHTYAVGKIETALITQDFTHSNILEASFGSPSDPTHYQTFTATHNSDLLGVDVKLRKINGYDQSALTLALYASKDGKPTGDALASAEIEANSIDNFVSIVQADLVFNGLRKDREYAIVLSQRHHNTSRYAWLVDDNTQEESSSQDTSTQRQAWLKLYLRDRN